jgi:hypothetical protein
MSISIVKNKSHFLLLAMIASGLSGCRSIYMPTTPNAPLFQREDQGQVEFTGFFNGMNLKTAYTPVNHFALQANGHFTQQFTDPGVEKKHHRYLELAAGTYHCFRNNSVIEFYIGYGEGSSVFHDGSGLTTTPLITATGHYKKLYAQINFGRHHIRKGVIGMCLRVGDVRYTYTSANIESLVNTTIDHPSIEPYFFISRKVADHLSFITHFGITILDGSVALTAEPTIRTNYLNVGVGLRLSLGENTE